MISYKLRSNKTKKSLVIRWAHAPNFSWFDSSLSYISNINCDSYLIQDFFYEYEKRITILSSDSFPFDILVLLTNYYDIVFLLIIIFVFVC